MAGEKSELYSLLWEACNKLRGGVEPSRYKDYVLVLLFFKYVSDRYKGQPFAEFTVSQGASFDDLIAAKGRSDIGERVDKKSFWRIIDCRVLCRMSASTIVKSLVPARNW